VQSAGRRAARAGLGGGKRVVNIEIPTELPRGLRCRTGTVRFHERIPVPS